MRSTRLGYLVLILISSCNTVSLNRVKIGIPSRWNSLGFPHGDYSLTEGISACLQTATLSLSVKFLLGKGWVQVAGFQVLALAYVLSLPGQPQHVVLNDTNYK